MGDIGTEIIEVELEPIPEFEPVPEPVPAAPAEPVKEPA